MKKVLLLLIPFTILSLTSCDNASSGVSITCDEIEKVYLDNGYDVFHKDHNDESNNCYMVFKKNKDSNDAIYFNIYETNEDAQDAQKDGEWNLVLWFYSAINGETRWKQSKCYNNIQYDYFDSTLAKPFEDLLKLKNGEN